MRLCQTVVVMFKVKDNRFPSTSQSLFFTAIAMNPHWRTLFVDDR